MSSRLDDLLTSTSCSPAGSPSRSHLRCDLDERFSRVWDDDRALRVREGVLRRHDVRVRRDRALRRGVMVAGGAGLLVLALLRAASSAPAEPVAASREAPTVTAARAPEALASRLLADAGYARD